MPSPPQTPPLEPAPVPRLVGGRYRLEERLGEGAVGVVWRARHLGLQRDVALKLLRAASPDDADGTARFQREAAALGRLRHPHVVEVTDFGIDAEAGVPYLVMELLPSRTLADLLREAGPLPPSRALLLLDALAAAVDAAHAEGILHRDLKPENVALALNGWGEPHAKVLDFGLAEIAAATDVSPAGAAADDGFGGFEGARLTSTGALLGTPLYVAPEVIREGAAGPASDIYSLGVIAYEMLAGRPPFQGSTLAVLSGHLSVEPPAPPLPPSVWQALREPLAKDPALRPATAQGFVRSLRRAFEQAEAAGRRRAEIPRRLALVAVVTAMSWAAGLLLPAGIPPLERRLDDLRMEAAPPRRADQRILLVTLDETSLGGPTPLAARADEFGRAIDGLFAAGARGVAVDLVLPPQWQESPEFTGAVLRHSEAVTLAAFSADDGTVTGTDCAAGLLASSLGPGPTAALFGFVNLDEDPDKVIRRGRLSYGDGAGGEHSSWASRAASALGTAPRLPAGAPFRIDHRIEAASYTRLAWRDLSHTLAHRPELFRGRLVLVGGDFLRSGDDSHPVPAVAVSSLTLQALEVDTIAAGLPIREAERFPILAVAVLLTCTAGLAILLTRHAGRAAAGLGLCGLGYAAVSFPVFERTALLLPVTMPCFVALFGLVVFLVLRQILTPLPGRSFLS
jgi:CHASE2 domain-containing sensor protein